MPTIHLINGRRGGVGKSLFTCCLAHHCTMQNLEYVLIDADPDNPDVATVYGGLKDISFQAADEVTAMNSISASQVDRIFEIATEKPAIVNLPGNVHEQLKYWILDNDLLEGELVTAAEVKLVNWFLSNGSYTSINLFLDSLDDFQGKLPHVLVRNLGLSLPASWERATERDRFVQAKEKHQFAEIEFPGLRAAERDYLEENQIPFARALEDRALPVLSRQRLIKFLRATEAAIAQTNLVSPETVASTKGASRE